MPKIPINQIQNYSVDVTNNEIQIAQSLLNRKKIIVDEENVDVFKKLTNLPNCERLSCIELELTELPALPRCAYLFCRKNQLRELPALPKCLSLWCSFNQLTELPALPQCHTLDCDYNNLIELPALPVCTHLYCANNQLIELPALPQCKYLDCTYNQLTFIPPLPNCSNPRIHHNPILPIPLYKTNRAWWDSQQQRQLKQQLKNQLTQQQKKQIKRTDPISLQQFQSPALGEDFAIYDDLTLSHVPFRGMRGLDVTRNLPLKQAIQKYKTQQNQAKKINMKKDIAKYVGLLQFFRN